MNRFWLDISNQIPDHCLLFLDFPSHRQRNEHLPLLTLRRVAFTFALGHDSAAMHQIRRQKTEALMRPWLLYRPMICSTYAWASDLFRRGRLSSHSVFKMPLTRSARAFSSGSTSVPRVRCAAPSVGLGELRPTKGRGKDPIPRSRASRHR